MSSLYEIVLLVVLLLMAFEAGAFFLCKRRTYTLMVPVTFTAVILLFFAKFVLEPGDTFRPIPAVLNSSVFLTLHVFTIALGFAGMILSGVVSHLVLFRGPAALPSAEMPKGSPLYSLMYGTLVFGAVFTIIVGLVKKTWQEINGPDTLNGHNKIGHRINPLIRCPTLLSQISFEFSIYLISLDF